MGSTRARTPKNFVLDERLERYRDAIEYLPRHYAGCWKQACSLLDRAGAPLERVHLDLGCGKGSYLVGAALQQPRTLHIGVDIQPVCIAYAAQRVVEAGVKNALLVPGAGERVESFFAPGEVDELTLNFPTPHPRKREAAERLVTMDNLIRYKQLLAQDGVLVFRTDSEPLCEWALPQFEGAGYKVEWVSHDVRADHPDIPMSEYEERLSAEGARVHGICARPGQPADAALEKRARAHMLDSLYDYIPDDLYEGSYVPHGMGFAIEAFRNRRRNLEAKQRRGAGAAPDEADHSPAADPKKER